MPSPQPGDRVYRIEERRLVEREFSSKSSWDGHETWLCHLLGNAGDLVCMAHSMSLTPALAWQADAERIKATLEAKRQQVLELERESAALVVELGATLERIAELKPVDE